MSRYKLSLLACFAVAGLLVAGCGGLEEDNIGETDQAAKLVCEGADGYSLHTLLGASVGKFTIRNNQKAIFGTYKAENGWKLSKTRFHVARYEKNIPSSFEKYSRKKNFKKPRLTYTAQINMPKDWRTPGTQLFASAYAVVVKTNAKGKIIAKRVVWASTIIFKYKVKECYLDVSLPPTAVTMVPTVSSVGGYWKLALSKVPDGYDVWDGVWSAWCVEKLTYMYPGKAYTAQLVSSQDTANLPDRAKNVNWQLVNYLLNHKDPKATITDVQNAVWALLGYIGLPTDPEAKAMVLDAQKNGVGFRPKYGDDIAVIFLNATGVQLVFLEVAP